MRKALVFVSMFTLLGVVCGGRLSAQSDQVVPVDAVGGEGAVELEPLSDDMIPSTRPDPFDRAAFSERRGEIAEEADAGSAAAENPLSTASERFPPVVTERESRPRYLDFGLTETQTRGNWTYTGLPSPAKPVVSEPRWDAPPTALNGDARTKTPENALWRTFTVYFSPNDRVFEGLSAGILRENREVMMAMSAALLENPPYNVRIVGYAEGASGEGSGDKDNLRAISLERAEDVARFLELYGVERKRMSVYGAGSEFPLVSRSDTDNKLLSRRVECTITP